MEFQTFEEKFNSVMEKWFTDTNDSMTEFYNKQQNAIDEGLELIFSDFRSYLNSTDPDSYSIEIVNSDSSSNPHPDLTENLNFSNLETEPFQISTQFMEGELPETDASYSIDLKDEITLEVDISSSVELSSNNRPEEEGKSTEIVQFQTEQQLQQGEANKKLRLLLEFCEGEGNVICALIYDTGQINHGGRNAPLERSIDEKSDFQEQWDSISTDTGIYKMVKTKERKANVSGQICPQIDKKLDALGIQGRCDIIDITVLSDMHCRNRDVENGWSMLIAQEIEYFSIIFHTDLPVSKLWSHEIVGTHGNLDIGRDMAGQKCIWPFAMQMVKQGNITMVLVAIFYKDCPHFYIVALQYKSNSNISGHIHGRADYEGWLRHSNAHIAFGEAYAEDLVVKIGAKSLRQAASMMNNLAGDGTTSSVVLIQDFTAEGINVVASGTYHVLITRGMEKSTKVVVTELKLVSKDVRDNEFAYLSVVSSRNNYEVGRMIAEALTIVEKGKIADNSFYVIKGIQSDCGYISLYCVIGKKEKMPVENEDCKLLLSEKHITNVRYLVNVLEDAIRSGYPILIVGKNIEHEALATLVGKKVSGNVSEVILTKDFTNIVGEGVTQEAVNKRVAEVRNLKRAADQDYEEEKLNEEVARFDKVEGKAIWEFGFDVP